MQHWASSKLAEVRELPVALGASWKESQGVLGQARQWHSKGILWEHKRVRNINEALSCKCGWSGGYGAKNAQCTSLQNKIYRAISCFCQLANEGWDCPRYGLKEVSFRTADLEKPGILQRKKMLRYLINLMTPDTPLRPMACGQLQWRSIPWNKKANGNKWVFSLDFEPLHGEADRTHSDDAFGNCLGWKGASYQMTLAHKRTVWMYKNMQVRTCPFRSLNITSKILKSTPSCKGNQCKDFKIDVISIHTSIY